MIQTTDRLHALDAVRAFALLLGIVLHATMSFFLPIPVQDGSQSMSLAATFYVIHTFRMSLFFLIAGFFAHLLLQRRGARAFAKDRALRIGVPMLVGWILLAPPTLAILVVGLSRALPDTPTEGVAGEQGFPLIHLWFLYYLCLFYALALVLRAVFARRIDRSATLRGYIDRGVRGALSRHMVPLLLALPMFLVFYVDPNWPAWFGIQTPDTGFKPQLSAMLGFGLAFGFGWFLHRQPSLLDLIRQQWAANLSFAIGFSLLCLALIGPLPPSDSFTVPGPPIRRLIYALCYPISIWCWVLGLIGAALRFVSGPSVIRRYLADASYWMYLIHLPIVFGLQVLMADWPVHWSIKFPLILTITLLLLLASYHYGVRNTLIGEVLNGRKYPRLLSLEASDEQEPKSQNAPRPNPAAIAQLNSVGKRYGQTLALDNLCLAVQAGEVLALLGANGAGKTTAIGLWLGLLEPDAGSVSLLGGSPLDVHSRLGIGVMMQDVNLSPMLSAREHIALASSYYRDPMSVQQVIELTGLRSFADKRYQSLSGGQKRQVQFAVAICGRPQLLFLDEPSVGLDVQAREALWRTIRALVDTGCSIVLTTHYLEEAQAIADRVALLAYGKLVAEGSVEHMRALVGSKRIRCRSALDVEIIKNWPGVLDAQSDAHGVLITAANAEQVVQRLFAADPHLQQLEVQQASLAEALNTIQEAA